MTSTQVASSKLLTLRKWYIFPPMKFSGVKRRALLSVFMVVAGYVGSAAASQHDDASQKVHEARVFANSLKYFSGISKSGDGYSVGIVYSPHISGSRAAAEAYAAAMNKCDDAQKEGLNAKVVNVYDLKGSGVNIVYLGPDLSDLYSAVYPVAKSSHMFVYSHDAECVWQKLCPLAIKLDYTLEISLSDAAIKNFGFEVDPMLRLLVKRLER